MNYDDTKQLPPVYNYKNYLTNKIDPFIHVTSDNYCPTYLYELLISTNNPDNLVRTVNVPYVSNILDVLGFELIAINSSPKYESAYSWYKNNPSRLVDLSVLKPKLLNLIEKIEKSRKNKKLELEQKIENANIEYMEITGGMINGRKKKDYRDILEKFKVPTNIILGKQENAKQKVITLPKSYKIINKDLDNSNKITPAYLLLEEKQQITAKKRQIEKGVYYLFVDDIYYNFDNPSIQFRDTTYILPKQSVNKNEINTPTFYYKKDKNIVYFINKKNNKLDAYDINMFTKVKPSEQEKIFKAAYEKLFTIPINGLYYLRSSEDQTLNDGGETIQIYNLYNKYDRNLKIFNIKKNKNLTQIYIPRSPPEEAKWIDVTDGDIKKIIYDDNNNHAILLFKYESYSFDYLPEKKIDTPPNYKFINYYVNSSVDIIKNTLDKKNKYIMQDIQIEDKTVTLNPTNNGLSLTYNKTTNIPDSNTTNNPQSQFYLKYFYELINTQLSLSELRLLYAKIRNANVIQQIPKLIQKNNPDFPKSFNFLKNVENKDYDLYVLDDFYITKKIYIIGGINQFGYFYSEFLNSNLYLDMTGAKLEYREYVLKINDHIFVRIDISGDILYNLLKKLSSATNNETFIEYTKNQHNIYVKVEEYKKNVNEEVEKNKNEETTERYSLDNPIGNRGRGNMVKGDRGRGTSDRPARSTGTEKQKGGDSKLVSKDILVSFCILFEYFKTTLNTTVCKKSDFISKILVPLHPEHNYIDLLGICVEFINFTKFSSLKLIKNPNLEIKKIISDRINNITLTDKVKTFLDMNEQLLKGGIIPFKNDESINHDLLNTLTMFKKIVEQNISEDKNRYESEVLNKYGKTLYPRTEYSYTYSALIKKFNDLDIEYSNFSDLLDNIKVDVALLVSDGGDFSNIDKYSYRTYLQNKKKLLNKSESIDKIIRTLGDNLYEKN